MQSHSVNIPRLEYFHRKFDELNLKLTDIERRLNDLNQKMEFTKAVAQKLESSLDNELSELSKKTEETNKEIKDIKSLIVDSKLVHERMRKFRLPL